MTALLVRIFIKDRDDIRSPVVRERYGRLAGAVGIVSNLVLFAAKLLIGLVSGSLAIMADATNNLSDCASSVITLVGFKLAGMPADEEHPYGHARFEYISGLAVSFIVLMIGFQFLTSSFKKILHPESIELTAVTATILVLSIAVKLWQGRFNGTIGRTIGSATLSATAADSRNDAITTAAVLLGAATEYMTGLKIDGVMGLLVAAFIIVSGIRLVRETSSPLLGIAPDAELVSAISKKILAYETVLGTHDLVVHNYGPGRCFASVHVEFPANQDVLLSHDVADRIERDFAGEMQIQLVVHLDPVVTDDERVCTLRAFIEDAAKQISPALSVHDFRVTEGPSRTNLIFDVVAPVRCKLTDAEIRRKFSEKATALSDTYRCVITIDKNYTASKQED